MDATILLRITQLTGRCLRRQGRDREGVRQRQRSHPLPVQLRRGELAVLAAPAAPAEGARDPGHRQVRRSGPRGVYRPGVLNRDLTPSTRRPGRRRGGAPDSHWLIAHRGGSHQPRPREAAAAAGRRARAPRARGSGGRRRIHCRVLERGACGPFTASNRTPFPARAFGCLWCYVARHSTLTRPPHRYST